jgi:hypothetical protein
MLYEERRRDFRFAVTLNGSFAQGRASIVVENVGYRGLLLVASTPLALGELRQFGIVIPDEGRVALHGVPVRMGMVASNAESGACVLGVRLIGIEPRWERFVRSLHAASGRALKVMHNLALGQLEKEVS